MTCSMSGPSARPCCLKTFSYLLLLLFLSWWSTLWGVASNTPENYWVSNTDSSLIVKSILTIFHTICVSVGWGLQKIGCPCTLHTVHPTQWWRGCGGSWPTLTEQVPPPLICIPSLSHTTADAPRCPISIWPHLLSAENLRHIKIIRLSSSKQYLACSFLVRCRHNQYVVAW